MGREENSASRPVFGGRRFGLSCPVRSWASVTGRALYSTCLRRNTSRGSASRRPMRRPAVLGRRVPPARSRSLPESLPRRRCVGKWPISRVFCAYPYGLLIRRLQVRVLPGVLRELRPTSPRPAREIVGERLEPRNRRTPLAPRGSPRGQMVRRDRELRTRVATRLRQRRHRVAPPIEPHIKVPASTLAESHVCVGTKKHHAREHQRNKHRRDCQRQKHRDSRSDDQQHAHVQYPPDGQFQA